MLMSNSFRAGVLVSIACGLAMAVRNIVPPLFHGRSYQHGWPLVYMTRQASAPGPLTIEYGPWPFWWGSPALSPLTSFSGSYLALNCLVGCVVSILAGYSTWRLLTRYGFRVRFALWQLLGLITITCLALAVFPQPMAYLALFWAPLMLVYACLGIVIVAACDYWQICKHLPWLRN